MSKIIIENVRCSYVFVTEPRKAFGGKLKYSLQIILPKDHPQVKEIKSLVRGVAEEKFGSNVKLGTLKLPLRDGDEEREGEEYENSYFINANSARKPGIVNAASEPASENEMEELCYSGAYFHVSASFYAYNFEGQKGVAVGLNNIMLRKKGDRLDGSIAAYSEFSAFADTEDANLDDEPW